MASDFEVLTECVRVALADDTIAFGIFRVAESLKDSQRRVVWIPTTFDCEPIEYFNPVRDGETGEMGDSLLTDRVVVECHISGLDFNDACVIRRQVLNACQVALANSSEPLGGAYQSELEGHGGYMWGGASKIIQHFHWMINVAKPDNAHTIVREIDQTDELQTSGTTDEILIIPTPP